MKDTNISYKFTEKPSEFIEVSETYLLILEDIYTNNQSISKNDFIVMKSLIFDGIKYINILFEKSYLEESKELIDILTKIVNFLILILFSHFNEGIMDTDQLKNIKFIFSLKIHVLEIQFQIYFYLQFFEECENILSELMKIIVQTNLPKIKIGSCLIFQAIVKLCKRTLN